MLPNPTTPTPTDSADYHLILDELLVDGMAVSRLVRIRANQEAEAPAPDNGADAVAAAGVALDLATAHERVSRAVRRTIGLARRLNDPATPHSPQHRAAARKRIIREVEDAIQRQATRPTDAECLQSELEDRLDGPDLDDDIDARPVPEIIADICRDLGLAEGRPSGHPWKRRTPGDIASLCARAARPPAKPEVTPSAAPPDPIEPAADPERIFRLAATPIRTPRA